MQPLSQRLLRYGAVYLLWLVALIFATGGFHQDFYAWMQAWHRWDVLWYEEIWQQGYRHPEHKTLAFPPGYPLLAGVFSWLLSIEFSTAAMLLNIGAYFSATALAAELLAARMEIKPLPLFCLTLTSPVSYFVFPAYSDAVFGLFLWGALALALSSSASRRIWAGEILLLLLAPWIRITGYALAGWLILRRWQALAVLASLAGWLLLNDLLTGSPLAFFDAQQLFGMSKGTFFDGFVYSAGGVFRIPTAGSGADSLADYLQFHLLPVVYLLALAAAGLWFCRRRQWLIGITVLSILILSHHQVFWRSALRYDWPLMACLFVPLLQLAVKPKLNFLMPALCGALGMAQFILQVYFANRFLSGQWGF